MRFLIASLFTLFLLAACSPAPAPKAEGSDPSRALMGAPDGGLAAAVNGEIVSTPLLQAFAASRGLDLADAGQADRALDALIESLVLAQAALRSDSVNSQQLQAELTLARLAQLQAAYLSDLRGSVQISEEQLRDYYQQESQRAGDTDFHLAHILFAEEASATEAARRAAEPGTDFAALMEEYAAAGALQARDLGWGNRAQMPEPFPEVVLQLKDGEAAPVPVQTVYGWHVLQRVASRPFQPPTFDEVKENARALLVERAIGERVRALRSEASVQKAASGG